MPPLAAIAPAEVIVPEPVVVMLPVVEMAMLLAKSAPAIVPSKILAEVTAPVAMVVAKEPAEVVTSPVNAGKRAAARVPVTLVPERSTALAVICCPEIER